MSSTLPRTRSVSSTASSSTATYPKERVRPASLCESSWNKTMMAEDLRACNLQRTPSQANNLSTTVPTALVSQTLGGRHTPTRNSLRHSRMLVQAKNGAKLVKRRWVGGLGRVGVLVVTAEVVVGVMGVALAAWFLLWAPSLAFREVPHYAAIPVLLSGVLGAILIGCFQRHRHRTMAKIVKGVLIALCCTSIVACLSVCIFTGIHLSYLAPMTCNTKHHIITHAPSTIDPTKKIKIASVSSHMAAPIDYDTVDNDDEDGIYNDTVEPFEGSGVRLRNLHSDDELDYDSELEIETVTLKFVEAQIHEEIQVNVSSCVCQKHDNNWVRTMYYPDLTCNEVNNILPVLFVASCVLTVVGAILSGVILYLLWTFRNSFYTPAKHFETRPFIFTSNLNKNKLSVQRNSNGQHGNLLYTNGNSRYR